MSELKEDWINTGVGLGHAFRDLGKTVVQTGKSVVSKVEYSNK